jgi:Arc/MetJ-type ribon-helix-helix transcriptional regulator
MIAEYPKFIASHVSNEEYALIRDMVKNGKYPSQSGLIRTALKKFLEEHK